MPRKSPERINRLSAKMQWDLMNYVKESYAQSGLTDGAFAKQAEKDLGFPLTAHNVAGARETFDIPSNVWAAREAASSRDPSAVMQRLSALERIVHALEQRVQVYIDGCCKDPRSPK